MRCMWQKKLLAILIDGGRCDDDADCTKKNSNTTLIKRHQCNDIGAKGIMCAKFEGGEKVLRK